MTIETDAPEPDFRLFPMPVPPAGIPVRDERPMSSPQYARRQALQLAIAHHRATDAEFTERDVLETARNFDAYIRTGALPGTGFGDNA